MQMPLNLALRVAAVIIIVAAGVDFLMNGELLLQPVIVANILFVLSLFAGEGAQRIALITILLCGILLIGAVRFYLEGRYALPWAVMEFVVFGILGSAAWKSFRAGTPK